MSRSLHTQQLEIRAARRMVRPHTTRAAEGAILCGWATPSASAAVPLPIRIQRPTPGCFHPLRPCDIREALEVFGYAPFYGLKQIRLRHECGLHRDGLVFAEYRVGGEIHLYAVPVSPWKLPFLPSPADLEAFISYGANCAIDTRLRRATVEWPTGALRNFYRCDVLAHELGHHLLQHNRGKRTAQIRRRHDHEAFADIYSRRAQARMKEIA